MSENKEKGIIINGIDVFACYNIIFEHYDNRAIRRNVCECGLQGVEYYNMMCSYNPECYYKQLQRTQIQYNKLVEQNRSLQKELQQKNQEIEAFKLSENEAVEIIADLEEKTECLKCAAKISNDGLKAVTDKAIKLAEVNNVLIKTLKEIEEIAERDCFVCCNSYDFKECCDKGCINSKILKKTKEVKNEQQV